ncbi:hypothetical protein U2181_15245, partial [Listeria monocytogenes]|uniref:hypothetical protein n=1 Tax=Listeria monocytogenes TaxID=1639 RepID=UPI002FDC21D1
ILWDRGQRGIPHQTEGNAVANGNAEVAAHYELIGLTYTLPAAEIWIALTRHGAPVPAGTLNGIGVYAGIGVSDVVAVTPSPTTT